MIKKVFKDLFLLLALLKFTTFIQGCFVPCLFKIGQAVLEKKKSLQRRHRQILSEKLTSTWASRSDKLEMFLLGKIKEFWY